MASIDIIHSQTPDNPPIEVLDVLALPGLGDVSPVFESEIFNRRANAAFFVGILATPEAVVDESGWLAARRLRANVYIDEKGFLPETARNADGGEGDEDDLRSVQFGIYENQGNPGQARMVGTSRLIIKRNKKDLLPVEEMFPEAFASKPAEVNSTETSRVIARHEDKKLTRKAISLALIRAMAAWSITEEKRPVYATIDPDVRRMYDRMEFPYAPLCDLKYVDEYQSENLAVHIDPEEVIDMVKPASHSPALMKAFFANVHKTHGLGYYDAFLMNQAEDK